jgi:CO dehydrogenase/acetyl-CoA synthase beta subunit
MEFVMLENFIDRIMSDPLLLTVSAVIAVFAIIFLVRKLFKIGFSLIILAAVVIGVIYFTSDDPKGTIEQSIEKGQEMYDNAKDKAKEFSDEAKDVKKELEDKLPE